jgi:hypothetical protein
MGYLHVDAGVLGRAGGLALEPRASIGQVTKE